MNRATTQPNERFKKELGRFSLLAMSLGTVIGSGWLLLPGLVASDAGPASLISWVIAGVIMLIVCMVYAELGAAWPAAGAVALYPRLSHGSFAGHIAGWAAFVSYVIIPSAEAAAVTRYAAVYVPSFIDASRQLTGDGMLFGIALLALLGLLNYMGVKYLALFQNWITVLKYIPILLFLTGGALFLFEPENFSAFGGFMPNGGSGILLGTATTVFAYVGFRQALDFGAEARNPGRDMPVALFGTIIIAMITYFLIALVFVGGVEWNNLSPFGVARGNWHSLSRLPAPVYDILMAGGLGFIGFLVFIDGIASPNGPNATNIGSVPRVLYALAENRSMPSIFLHLNQRLGTPGWGLFVCFLIEVGFLLISRGGYGELISAINVAFMVAYAMGPVSNGGLRLIAPCAPRPYRVPLSNLVNPLAFVLASLLLFWSRWPLTGETLGILFAGVLIYIGYGLAGRVDLKAVRYGLWLITYLVVMALLSFLGDRHFGGIDVLPFGWDFLAVALASVALYYWGIQQSLAFHRGGGACAEGDVIPRHHAVQPARGEYRQ